jgi:IS1 family transposase
MKQYPRVVLPYVWETWELKTAKKSRKWLKRLEIRCGRIATDDWDSFVSTFAEDNHEVGKEHTVGYRRE